MRLLVAYCSTLAIIGGFWSRLLFGVSSGHDAWAVDRVTTPVDVKGLDLASDCVGVLDPDAEDIGGLVGNVRDHINRARQHEIIVKASRQARCVGACCCCQWQFTSFLGVLEAVGG